MSGKYICDKDACILVSDGDGSNKLSPPDPSVRWIIYGTSWCSYCTKARELIASRKQEYIYINVSNYSNGRSLLFQWTNGYPTVPVIYHNGRFIGGYTDLCLLKPDDK